MNSNLVPELRTDKNGVSSTRWVKPTSDDGSKLFGIPSPVAFNTTPHPNEALLDTAAHVYVDKIEEDCADDDEYMESAYETALDDFAAYPESIIAEIAKDGEDGGFLKLWGMKLLMEEGADNDLVLDYLKLADFLAENDFEEPVDAFRTTFTVSKAYPDVDLIPLDGEYPESRLNQLKALVMGTELLHNLMEEGYAPDSALDEGNIGSHDGLKVIADERLVKLLIDRAEDRDLIIDCMETRKIVDVDAVLAVIDSDVRSLSRGIL